VPGPYEGTHGFVFLYEDDLTDPREVVEELREHLDPDKGPVFFAASFEGDFAGFAHFAADDLEGLVDFTGSTLFDAGVRSDYVTEGAVYVSSQSKPMGPKRKSPRYCAICRIRTDDKPKTVLQEIAKAFAEERPFVGAARVIGGFQLLVELGANELETLHEAVERLRELRGVGAVQVGTTDIGRERDQEASA
jgi:hypothetical protein